MIKTSLILPILLFVTQSIFSADMSSDTTFWISALSRLEDPKVKTDFVLAEQYLLKAHQIAIQSEDIPAFILAKLSRDLIRLGNQSKKGRYPNTYDENMVRIFERIEYQGMVSVLSHTELVKQFPSLNNPQQKLIIQRLVEEGKIEIAEKLVNENGLSNKAFAGILMDFDADLVLVDKYFYKDPVNNTSINGNSFDHYVGRKFRSNDINIEQCISYLNKSKSPDRVKQKIIARNIPFSKDYKMFPKYLRKVNGRDESRVIQNLAYNLSEITSDDQINYLVEILAKYSYDRKVVNALLLINEENLTDEEIFNKLYSDLVEFNKTNLSQETLSLIRQNKSNLDTKTLMSLGPVDETNVLLRLATRLITMNEYIAAEECASQEKSSYQYKLIEQLCKMDQTSIAGEWIEKYYPNDKLPHKRDIIISLIRQSKHKDIEAIISEVSDRWKIDYYATIATQYMGIK